MKFFRLIIITAFISALFICSGAAAVNVPELKGHVNDYADLLSQADEAFLEEKLSDLEKSDSTQICILTVPSVDGADIESYSMKVAETWKIGQKGKDNGILFTVAFQERKVRIETGYGLEGRLTDIAAGKIIRSIILPEFRRGDYSAGITAGTEALISAVKGEFSAVSDTSGEKDSDDSQKMAVFIFYTAGLIFISYFFAAAFQKKRFLRSVLAFPFAGGFTMVLFSLTASAFLAGGLAGAVLAFLFKVSSGGSGGTGWKGGFPGGPGGFSGFGGGFGGGDFGGGFGGGGGGFGGGGATGSW